MSGLSFGQWMKLGFGAVAVLKKHSAAIPAIQALMNDLLDLWQQVVPPDVAPEEHGPPISPLEAAHKVRSGGMTEAEKLQFDRASQSSGL